MFGLQRIVKRVPAAFRSMSTYESLIDLTIDKEGNALMALQREPVNSINLEVLQQIISTLDAVEKDGSKGLVVTSAYNVFSAGIDLSELHNPDPVRLREFWKLFRELSLKIYSSAYTTAAAINGYTAAGACGLSILCDYRVMVNSNNAKIGFNDTAVGIVPSFWICNAMDRVVGYRQSEIMIMASPMYTPDEALKINLIDELASDKEDAIEKCKIYIRRFDDIPLEIRARTKRRLRGSIIKSVIDNRDEDLHTAVQGILDPLVQERIGKYVQQLKAKKGKK